MGAVALEIAAAEGGFPAALPWGSASGVILRDFRAGAPGVEGRFLIDGERLYARLQVAGAGVRTLYLDPAGDRLGYFEIGASERGSLLSRVARRGRTGTKFSREWRCEGGVAVVEGAEAFFALPLAALGSLPSREGNWLVGAALNADFEVLRPAPLFVPLTFPSGNAKNLPKSGG